VVIIRIIIKKYYYRQHCTLDVLYEGNKADDKKLRENRQFEREVIDLGSPLLVEGPAYGAHNGESSLPSYHSNKSENIDVTAISGPEMIQRHLKTRCRAMPHLATAGVLLHKPRHKQ
jgi:hypothetical protein